MIEITRNIFTSRSTIGVLRINNEYVCYTLEDICRPEGVKVYGETAIPEGIYDISVTYSERFKRPLPLIYNRDDFSVIDSKGKRWTGIRIHPGNSSVDTDGCILPGLEKKTDWVQGSTNAFEKLFTLINTEIGDNKSVKLTIKNIQI